MESWTCPATFIAFLNDLGVHRALRPEYLLTGETFGDLSGIEILAAFQLQMLMLADLAASTRR